jgi:hypothetical protein
MLYESLQTLLLFFIFVQLALIANELMSVHQLLVDAARKKK